MKEILFSSTRSLSLCLIPIISFLLNAFFFRADWDQWVAINLGALGVFGLCYTLSLIFVHQKSRSFWGIILFYLLCSIQWGLKALIPSIAAFWVWMIVFIALLMTFNTLRINKLWIWPQVSEVFLFFGIFFAFLILVSFFPHAQHGEKMMDIHTLHFFSRNPVATPLDPWLWGEPFRYYYLGYYIWGSWSSLWKISMEHIYFYSFALNATLLLGPLISYLKAYKVSLIYSILIGLSLMVASHLSLFLQFVDSLNPFYQFWNLARTFQNGFFSEYPWWSFLWGDLHPHVMAYPLTLALNILFFEFLKKERSHLFFETGLFYLALGVLLGLNGWDFLAMNLVIGFGFLFRPKDWKLFILWPLQFIFASYFIFVFSANKNSVGMMGIVVDLWGLLKLHSGYILLVILFLLSMLKSKQYSRLGPAFFSVVLLFLPRYFYYADGMNTVFKSYVFWWSLSTPMVIAILLENPMIQKGWIFLSLSCLLGMFLIEFPHYKWSEHQLSMIQNPNHSLLTDDQRRKVFQLIKDPNEYVIIEKERRDFDPWSFPISTYTGIPLYFGWQNHLEVRQPKTIVRQRRAELSILLQNLDSHPKRDFEKLEEFIFLIKNDHLLKATSSQ